MHIFLQKVLFKICITLHDTNESYWYHDENETSQSDSSSFWQNQKLLYFMVSSFKDTLTHISCTFHQHHLLKNCKIYTTFPDNPIILHMKNFIQMMLLISGKRKAKFIAGSLA